MLTHGAKSQKATNMDDHAQNVLGPRTCDFPAGLGKEAGLDWSERDPTPEGPHLEEETIPSHKGVCMGT